MGQPLGELGYEQSPRIVLLTDPDLGCLRGVRHLRQRPDPGAAFGDRLHAIQKDRRGRLGQRRLSARQPHRGNTKRSLRAGGRNPARAALSYYDAGIRRSGSPTTRSVPSSATTRVRRAAAIWSGRSARSAVPWRWESPSAARTARGSLVPPISRPFWAPDASNGRSLSAPACQASPPV